MLLFLITCILYVISEVFNYLISILALEKFIVYFSPRAEHFVKRVQNVQMKFIKCFYLAIGVKELVVNTSMLLMNKNGVADIRKSNEAIVLAVSFITLL